LFGADHALSEQMGMKPLVSCHLTWRTRVIVSAAALLVATACNKNPASSSCNIITGVTTTTFPAAGGSASISVNTPATCAWTATSNASFLTVTQGASGMGDGTVQFAVAPNTGAERTATLTITGTAITITQRAP
jgi:hypothetical protein